MKRAILIVASLGLVLPALAAAQPPQGGDGAVDKAEMQATRKKGAAPPSGGEGEGEP